eukprot:maker-scaffold_97-snap-gene-0.1-mRNA-1 protein AED:0.14 eAED:0.14 QI:0/0/0/1/0.5/0.33/3/0/319
MNKFTIDESMLDTIVADNTNTNKKFVGCLNHYLALGVRVFIKSETPLSEALDKVQLLFYKIKKSKKLTVALRKYTDKVLILPNVTRWSGKFLMMKRYLDIWMFIAQFEDDEVSDLILGEDERRILGKHVKFLAVCDLYTVALQNAKFNLGQGKKAVANLLRDVNNNESLLIGKTALARLVKDPSEEETKAPSGDSVTAEVFSQLRKSKKKSIFADVRFIPATSYSVERLFSQCKPIFSDKRNKIISATLNRLVFLKINKDELMDSEIYVKMKKKIPGSDDKEEEEEEMVEQMEEENDEEERVDLILEGFFFLGQGVTYR